MRRTILALALLLCCGVPESVNPLVPPQKGVLDKALLGTWEGMQRDEKLTLVFEVKAGAVVTITALPTDPKEKPVVFEGHATNLGGTKYLNVRMLDKGEYSGWLIVRYDLGKDGALTLSTMKTQAIREAVEGGKLKGKSGGGGTGEMIITDTAEKLAAFIKASKPDTLYETFGTFHKKG